MIEQAEPVKDPDFTPLLDVVFLLIFFFAMTADFLQRQSFNDNIVLPEAQFAGPLDNTNLSPAYVNLDKHGKVVGVTADISINNDADMITYLSQVKSQLDELAAKQKIENPKMLVILRADRETRYIDVWKTLDMCTRAGYSQWQIRVLHGF